MTTTWKGDYEKYHTEGITASMRDKSQAFFITLPIWLINDTGTLTETQSSLKHSKITLQSENS